MYGTRRIGLDVHHVGELAHVVVVLDEQEQRFTKNDVKG